MTYSDNASRREFLRRTAALSALGVAGPTALNMSALTHAAAANASDYKALVCVFLYGANDNYNTFVPYDPYNHSVYQQARPTLAISRSDVAATLLNPNTPLSNDKQYALAQQMPELSNIWNDQQMAVLLNVGPLSQPTTWQQYKDRSVPLPPKIFSHNDQQSVWQSLAPEGATTGWGGRMADLFLDNNDQSDIFKCVSVSGSSVFLSGDASVQYQVTPNGSIQLKPITGWTYGSKALSAAIEQLVQADQTHLIKRAYNDITRRSIAANSILTNALSTVSEPATSFGTGPLSSQLKMVARIIAARDQLQVKRQVFFVGIGGFDVHNNLNTDHPPLLAEVNRAMSDFYAETKALNISGNVTTFTASDFGRTLYSNGDGTDHGWGSHHMIMGGAVNGRDFYGTAPELGNNGPDDVGRGRLLPTTAVEQMAATMGRWFGCSETELRELLPALIEFDRADLGFMSG